VFTYMKLFLACAISFVLLSFALPVLAQVSNAAGSNLQSPVTENKTYLSQEKNADLSASRKCETISKASNQPGQCDKPSYGGPSSDMGSVNRQPQAMQVDSDKGGGGSGAGGGAQFFVEVTAMQTFTGFGPWKDVSTQNGASAGTFPSFLNDQLDIQKLQIGNPGDDSIASSNSNFAFGGGGGGGGCSSGTCQTGSGNATSGLKATTASQAYASMAAAAGGSQKDGDVRSGGAQAQANQAGCQGSAASSAGEDALLCIEHAFEGMTQYLINVANEDAGSPCASDQVSKTYENAVWMVMQMYKACFLPMAILFLLPGAIITNTKTMVSFGILKNANDEDAVNPFAGIIRSMIAIFLIPATQMIVSYMVDVGNSLQLSCQPYIDIPLIMLWCQEQVQTYTPDQQGSPIKDQPIVKMAPWRGKFAGMPVGGAVLESVSGLDVALQQMANECMHLLAEGLTICYAFQLVMICYLLLLGPLAAAFFAWPSVGRDLFRKAFASWVDGVVVLCLWKFWWEVVLICMTVRLQSGGVNPFDPFETYYLMAFMCILMFVPFNPFDFKPGSIVGKALEKAQAVASKAAAASGSGGASGGGGGSAGGNSPTSGGKSG
jgi:hypothetical protein